MKKRILAVLLMVVILAALLAGLSVTAAAENDISGDTISGYVIPYTLKAGDTVLKVCNTLGIDFHKNQALITKINSIADYSKLPVGKVVWLPATSVGSASDYYTLKTHKVVSGDNVNTLLTKYSIASTDAMLNKVNNNLTSPVVGSTITFPVYKGSATAKMADTTATVIGTGTAAAAATATGISTTTGTTVPASGSVAYYLLAYQMKAGDTVGAVCTANGINFAQHSALISRINGITNYNRIPVGRVVMLPTATATGATYSVVAHQIQAGETANSICAAYGINLANNLTLIKGLNNTNNLNYIQAGGLLYVPVGGGVSPSPSPSPTPDPTPTPSGTYKLSKDDCDNGSFVLKVDGVEATSAVEGKTVTIICNGAAGYAQKTVSAHMTGDSSKVVKVTNNTFVMPDYNVTVSVTFGKATMYAINCASASNGKYELVVDEKIVTDKTYAGAAVTVNAKPNSGYVVDEIKVYKTGDPKTTISVTNGKFTMPQHKVTVEVIFKAAASYEYPVNAKLPFDINGSFELKVGSTVVGKAASGKTITVAYKANNGYKLDTIIIHYPALDTDGSQITKDVTVSNAQFKMPSFDDKIPMSDREVKVEVKFIQSKTYTITINPDTAKTGNAVVVQVNGSNVTKAEVGRYPVIVPKINKAGFELAYVEVLYQYSTSKNMKLYPSDLEADATFEMLAENVTIVPTFNSAQYHNVSYKCVDYPDKEDIDFTVQAIAYTDIKEGDSLSVLAGSTVNMSIKPKNVNNFAFKSVKAVYQYNGKDVEVKVSGNNFTMPAYDTVIYVELEKLTHAIDTVIMEGTTDITSSFGGSVEYIVNSKSVTAAAEGENVVIKPTMEDNYKLKNIKVTYKEDGETKEVSVTDKTFKMPAYKATVTIKVEQGAEFNINIADTVNGKVHVENSSNDVVTKATKGTTGLIVVCNPDQGFEVDSIKVMSNGTDIWSGSDFDMPGNAVNVKVTFKAKSYSITKAGDSNGLMKVTDSLGASISNAKAGDTVKFEVTANEGYKLEEVTVTNSSNNIILSVAAGGSFTMPADDVTITANIVKMADSLKVTKAVDPENGSISLFVNGNPASFGSPVKEGDTIKIDATPFDGYKVTSISITKVKSGTVTSLDITDSSFTMPGENVKVEVVFTKD